MTFKKFIILISIYAIFIIFIAGMYSYLVVNVGYKPEVENLVVIMKWSIWVFVMSLGYSAIFLDDD